MATLEDVEKRLRSLEAWANREALRRGALGVIVERMVAEQLAAMSPQACEKILNDLANPYRFQMSVTGPKAGDEPFKRALGEAASRQIEDVVETIRKRVAELRKER